MFTVRVGHKQQVPLVQMAFLSATFTFLLHQTFHQSWNNRNRLAYLLNPLRHRNHYPSESHELPLGPPKTYGWRATVV